MPSGNIFKREHFTNRYRSDNVKAVARWISMDTALSDSENAATSAAIVGELTPEYYLRIVDAWADRVQYPQLVKVAKELASKHNYDEALHGIVIEKKASGFSLIQTLKQSSEPWLSGIIKSYTPKVGKEYRWSEAAVWTSLHCVQLPDPDERNSWLYDFETDLYEAPDIPFLDRVDAFAQLVLFTENLLAEGRRARKG
jgi:phage terminase large subunit-like protein